MQLLLTCLLFGDCDCHNSSLSRITDELLNWLLPLTHLMQDAFIKYGFKRDIWSSKIRGVDERVIERSGYNELCSSKEGSEVAVKVVLLQTSLASGGWPQFNRVSCEAHIDQSPTGGCHQYQAAPYDQKGVTHTEGTPGAEDSPQCILKPFAQRFTARCIYWEEKNTGS